MKRFSKLVLGILFGGWVVLSPLVGLSNAYLTAHAQEDINSHLITNVTPEPYSTITTTTPIISATFNYEGRTGYAFAKVYIDGVEDTAAANPQASGFSYTPNLSDNWHTVQVVLVNNQNDVAVRTWYFILDSTAPTSKVDQMSEYVNNSVINVGLNASDNLTGIGKIELWYKINHSDWLLGPVFDYNPITILFDTNLRGGEGYYEFTTVAYDKAGNRENKILTAEAATTFDGTAPAGPHRHLIAIEQKAPGNEDAIVGLPGSVSDDTVRVGIFGNTNLTNLLVTSPIYGDSGSKRFGAYGIGDNKYEKVFVVAYDAAGNASLPTEVENDFGIAANPTNIQVQRFDSRRTIVSWDMVNGADAYRVRYRQVGENAFSDFIQVEETLNSALVSGLTPGVNYEFAVTTKDLHGSESPIMFSAATLIPSEVGDESSFNGEVRRTDVFPTPVPSIILDTTPSETETPTLPQDQQALSTPTPTEPITPTEQTPQAEENVAATQQEDEGEVKSEAADTAERNWTPWIVLAILIILAGAATGGYFYWFGGPEEVTTTTKTAEQKKEEKTDKDNEARW